MNGLDLFSGIGGITKALEGYVRPIAYCEIEPYARGVLLSRMASGDLPNAPIWDDVTTLRGSNLPHIDIIYGGFPCQDISVAGKQIGLGGERSGLFSEICRLAVETKAEWLFLENVPNIRTKGLGRVLKELDGIGYDCRWCIFSARDIGAPHVRERWFLLAHSKGVTRSETDSTTNTVGTCGATRQTDMWRSWDEMAQSDWKLSESDISRTIDGIPYRVDRARALGNAVVPAQAREAFERLLGIKGHNG